MAKSRSLRAADKRVVGWGLVTWLALTIGGSFWALPHIEDELDEESLGVESYVSADNASVVWNGRDGYLQLPPGATNAELIAADLASIDGARDVEIQFDKPAQLAVDPDVSTSATGTTAAAPTSAPTTTAPPPTEPPVTEPPVTEAPPTTRDEQVQASASLDEVIASSGIEFQAGTSTPTAATEGSIDQIADVLRSNESLNVTIGGHTDSFGSAVSNQTLSEQRAQAVMAGLVQRGIDPARLEAVGFGGERPIDTNDTPEGRQRNRRVEIDVKDNE